MAETIEQIRQDVIGCRACPRLVEWCESVARERRAAFRDEEYWGKPIPGFGDPNARLLVVGLAPAAHGGNRTGRVFTGDRSADWLYRAMHRAGFANQPNSTHVADGLELRGAYVTAAVRCAPPANKPTPAERDRCAPFLAREVAAMPDLCVVVALGKFASDALAPVFGLPKRPAFGHGRESVLPGGLTLLCSFHPSQQNTFTGKLTEAMLDAVFSRARELCCYEASSSSPESVS